VTWEDESFSRRRLDLPEMTAEQTEMLLSTVPAEQREMFRKGEMTFEIRTRHQATLVERHADRIVLEIATRASGPGVDQKFTRREVIPAVPPPPRSGIQEISHWEEEDGSGSATVVKQSFDDIFKGVIPTEGEETIEVAGRSMACRWIERVTDTPMGRFQVKFWRSPEIPGGIARASMRTDGPMEKQTGETKIVSFERKAP
jgi:hypothetical protein